MGITNHARVVIYTRGVLAESTRKDIHVSLLKCGTAISDAARLALIRANSDSVSDRSRHDIIIELFVPKVTEHVE